MNIKLIIKKIWPIIILGLAVLIIRKYNSLDGIYGLMASIIFPEYMYYADGYSDEVFKSIKVGMGKTQVRQRIGEPLAKFLEYQIKEWKGTIHIWFENDHVETFIGPSDLEQLKGKSFKEVIRTIGKPEKERWLYSMPKRSSEAYRRREIVFRNGKVVEKIHEFFSD
jgi:outer membrane protein assembly factor BamE (lipoprotein component of BamABCDE complex)